MAKRIVIVGAGPGGLASAMLLAGAGGMDVTLLERQPYAGGRTSSHGAAGFRFDLGPTFFLYPRILEEIYTAVGRDLRREVPMVRLDPHYRLVFGSGGELACTSDVEQMQQAVFRLSPTDAAAFPRFLADNREKFARFTPCLQSPFLSWRDLLTPRMLRLLPWLRPWRSIDGDLRTYFRDERVRLAFSFQSKYLGMSPFNCPSLFSILSFLEYEYGVFHPLGGCGAVSQSMVEIARDLGVDVRLNEAVTGLEFHGRRVRGVHTAAGSYPADALVINADFAHAMQRLVPDRLRRRWSDKQLARKRYSCSTYMLYLGIEGRYDHLAHHTIYLSRDYRGNLRDIEQRHVLSNDPSVYVQNACVTDPSLAPAGMSTLYVLAPVTHQHNHVDWSRQSRWFRQVVIGQLAKLGLDDVESRIRYERVVTPHDWQHQHAIYRGATFNLAHDLGQMLHLRPKNRFDELDGVYLVGGGTHPGSGLPVIYESARISSTLLLEDFGMAVDWARQPPPQHTHAESIPVRPSCQGVG